MTSWRYGRAFLLLVVLVCSCAGRTRRTTTWFGDSDAIEARVYVDGKLAGKLQHWSDSTDYLHVTEGVPPCYGHGDTAAAAGNQAFASIDLPVERHTITVVSAANDTLRCETYINDSPVFIVYMRCGAIVHPGARFYREVTVRPKRPSVGR